MENLTTKELTLKQVKLFLFYTFAITWFCWLSIILANKYFNVLNYGDPMFWILYTIGSLGPALSAYLIFRQFRASFAQKSFIKYIFNKKISGKVWLIFSLFLVWRLFMIWISFGINKPISMLSILVNFPFLIVLGGLEELGWRGILQPQFEKIILFLPSVLAVGVVWSVWHLPLWFINGTVQSVFPFWLYLISGIVLTASFTTLYKYTNSLFLSIITHAWFNACIGLALYVGNNGVLQLNINWNVIVVFSVELLVSIILGIIYKSKNNHKLKATLISLMLIVLSSLSAQVKAVQWNLTNCIEYALKNNIQIKKSQVILEQSIVGTKQAKAQLMPTLYGSINQNLTNSPLLVDGGIANLYSGNYGISSTLLLFDGGKTMKNIRQQLLLEQLGQYNVQYSQKSIQFSILQVYVQILYATESINIDSATVEVSKFQFERGRDLLTAGSISKVDLAKLESQFSSDKYLLLTAINALATQKMNLKQLLELAVADEIIIEVPILAEVDILLPLPSLQSIYETSLNVMPQLKSSKINLQIAELETAKAQSGFLPTVTLKASVGTNHSSLSDYNFNQQVQNGLNEGIGISVSIPIFTNRTTKSAVEINRLSEQTAFLNKQDAEKSLLIEIESSYQDALSAQSQYMAAIEKVKAFQISYDLIEQQFSLGLKNTLELLIEKNNLLVAKQGKLQAKYLSIMNVQMLNLYQDFPLGIK